MNSYSYLKVTEKIANFVNKVIFKSVKIYAKPIRHSWQSRTWCVLGCVCDFRSPAALLTVVQAGRPSADPEPFENMIVILVRIWPGCLLPL